MAMHGGVTACVQSSEPLRSDVFERIAPASSRDVVLSKAPWDWNGPQSEPVVAWLLGDPSPPGQVR